MRVTEETKLLPAAEVIEVAIAAGLEIGEDNYGQIIIHTNLREVNTPDGLTFVEIEAEAGA